MGNVIGERIKALRLKNNITIAELSNIVGLSAPAISNYERGTRVPDADTLIKLAKYFRCTSDYVLGLSEDKNVEEKLNRVRLTEITDSLLSNLPDNEKKLIIGILYDLIQSTSVFNSTETSTKFIKSIADWISLLMSTINASTALRSNSSENIDVIRGLTFVFMQNNDKKVALQLTEVLFDFVIESILPGFLESIRKDAGTNANN